MVVLAVGVAWAGFRVATHRHTGILHLLAKAKHSWQSTPDPPRAQALQQIAPPGPHSVRLTWRHSTSPVAGYNVYRRDASGTTKLNHDPIHDTSYVDASVQSGHTYYYLIKAVGKTHIESSSSNEFQAVVPSP